MDLLYSTLSQRAMKQILTYRMSISQDLKVLKVLVAEDNEINQKIILLMLKKLGINADIAANGLEVIEALKIKKYNLILMDIQMPEMDGIETTHYIINKYDTAIQPVIIALTANALPGDREKYINIGMSDYISKPIEEKKLLEVLHECARSVNKLPEPAINPESEQPETAYWDISRLEMLKDSGDNDKEFFQGLLETFCTLGHKYLTVIQEGIQLNDRESLQKNIHALKGMSLSIGAIRLSALSLEIETILQENKPVSQEKLTLLEHALTESIFLLRSHCVNMED